MKRPFVQPLIGFALLLLLVAGSFAPIPSMTPKAHAQWAVALVGDASPPSVRDVMSAALIIVAKTALNAMTQSIVNWINSGFKGSPAFGTDLNRSLSNLSDAVAQDFFNGLDQVAVSNTGISLRAPFQDQINAALRNEFYQTTASYGFNLKYPYQNCSSGNGFSFNSWFCESQNPANNPYGRYELARNELFKELNQATQTRLTELGWGKGFLSWRGSCGAPSQAATTPTDVDVQDALINGKANPTDLNPAAKEGNYNCPIQTPGSVIENQLENTLGSGVRQLELADNFNAIISALATQLIGQVLGNGGLSGASAPSAGGGSSVVDHLAASMSQGFALNISNLRTQLAPAAAGWQKIGTAATTAKQACANDSAKSAQANQVLAQATQNYTATNTALSSLDQIEADRVRLTSSPTTTNADISALVDRFNTLLSQTGSLAQGGPQSQDTSSNGSTSLYSQMTALAASCR